MSKLNNRLIERAKPSPRDKYIADGDGLFLRVMPNGTKTFCFRYTWGTKRRLLALGPFPILSVAEAREQANEVRRQIFLGVDPIEQAQITKPAEPDSPTVRTLIANWTERYAKPNYKRLDTQLRMVEKDILPVIGSMLVKDITKKHVSQVINRVVDRGARVKANRVLSLMKTIFDYAAQQGEIDESPVTMTRKGAGGREKPKNRVLGTDEIKVFWTAINIHSGFMSWRTKRILHLILLTAQRPGEVAGMMWGHVDLEKRIWQLPAELVKSERNHVVHLSEQAVEILEFAQGRSTGSRYVFPSARRKGKPTGTQTLSMALLRMFEDGEFGAMKPFTPHDLRRTAATRMADISVHAHIVEKILNHKMKGVMAVYNYAEYLEERKQALIAWGNCVGRYSDVRAPEAASAVCAR
ncbi:site-specific integrase [Paraburkholderia sp. BL17N1]|uniref:tyrosine-type recombinase/integrase n=1 Tax=Paraburkholderia sp. BL17N1 TaxID=1938798 RepID=UPI000EAF06AD|nr:site-specific integrase [Paraburkholderia sp. BL17N1]RKR45967.1 integrase [Paraburkholderia sp. BL17N1]